MIKIDEKRLVSSSTLIIPASSIANIEFGENNWRMKAELSFNDTAPTPAIKIKPIEGGASIIFDQWNKTLGQATMEPTSFARLSNGSELYLMATNFRIGDTNQLIVQFLIGNEK